MSSSRGFGCNGLRIRERQGLQEAVVTDEASEDSWKNKKRVEAEKRRSLEAYLLILVSSF